MSSPRPLLHLGSLLVVLLLTTVAWVALGALVVHRTEEAQASLDGEVEGLWGGPQRQSRPRAVLETPEGAERGGGTVVALTPEATRIAVDLSLEHRRKGLLWYSTYRTRFEASYRYVNETGRDAELTWQLPLPSPDGVYDDFRVRVGEEERTRWSSLPGGAEEEAPSMEIVVPLPAGASETVAVGYTTQGLDEWRYRLGGGADQVRDFRLVARTDFDEIDFPPTTMSPTTKERRVDGGWELTWSYEELVGGRDIAVAMPRKLNPGPLAAQITLFAPVSLAFFFGVLFFLSLLRDIPLHPMHYLFLAAAFFSFHLLFAHLVDHLPLWLSFVLASAVSVFLVVSYLRVVVDPSFAWLEAGGLQLLYLVFFSLAHFWEGWTGLTVTIGAILTLFFVMQGTARLDWDRAFRAESPEGDDLAPHGGA